jgi:hypothetical protein
MNEQSAPGPGGPAPSEEELRAQLEAELRRLRVEDVLVQTVVSLLNLGARRAGLTGAGDEEVDLGQVEAAIEGARSLLELLERRAPADLAPLRDALAQLQMAYAQRRREAPAGAEPPPEAPGPAQPAASRPPDEPATEAKPGEEGSAVSSGRLWIPGR